MKTFRHFFFLTLCVMMSGNVCARTQINSVKIISPNHQIEVDVAVTNHHLTYSVVADKSMVIMPSTLGITVDSVDLGLDASIVSSHIYKKVDEKYNIYGSHNLAVNKANEAKVIMRTKTYSYALYVRVYDDGVAIRYSLPKEIKRVDGESTSWSIPVAAKSVAWMDYSQCYEGLSHVTSFDKIPVDKTVMGPITIDEGHHFISISEADCENFSDMAFIRRGHSFEASYPFARKGWEVSRLKGENPSSLNGMYDGLQVTPWRTVIIAKSMTALVNSDLLTNLCPAPVVGSDFSWVKPGRCLWQWWSIGAPQCADQRSWYDAAVKLKWEYYLIDEGWNDWKSDGEDQWSLLKAVIAYGKEWA
jgi:alpha-glucosidase